MLFLQASIVSSSNLGSSTAAAAAAAFLSQQASPLRRVAFRAGCGGGEAAECGSGGGSVEGRLRSHSLDSGAPLLPPLFPAALGSPPHSSDPACCTSMRAGGGVGAAAGVGTMGGGGGLGYHSRKYE